MANYCRITAYHSEKDISVIVDSNGMFEKLWQCSSYLVQKGFKIIEVCTKENIAESTFTTIDENSNKLFIRAINRGRPEIQEFPHNGRPCKAITACDKIYGLFVKK